MVNLWLISCVIGLSVINFQTCESFYAKELIVNDDETAIKWSESVSDFDSIFWSQRVKFLHLLGNFLNSKHSKIISKSCLTSLQLVQKGLQDRKLWSYKLIDSWAKGDHRLSYGFVSDFGKLEPCVDLKVSEDGQDFMGRHCAVTIGLPVPKEPIDFKPMVAVKLNLSKVGLESSVYQWYADRLEFWTRESFSFGTCWPDTCSRTDVELIVRSHGLNSNLKIGVRKYCDSHQDRYLIKWTPGLILSVLITISVLGLASFATWLHVVRDWHNIPIPKIGSFEDHFNVIKHVQNLVRPTKDDVMRPLEALVVFAQAGAICAHTFQAGTLFSTQFPTFKDHRDLLPPSDFLRHYVFVGTMGVQLSFVLSGFFNCYIMYPMFQKMNGKIPFFLFALKRWLRIVPALGATIILIHLTKIVVIHPTMKEASDLFSDACHRNWFSTIFMLNNFGSSSMNNVRTHCVIQSWFLSVDFQMWLISYVPLYLLYKKPKLGISFCGLMLVASLVANGLTTYLYETPAGYPVGREFELWTFFVRSSSFMVWYGHVFANSFSYFFGFLVAYYCLTGPKITSYFSWRWQIIGGFLTSAAGTINIFPSVWMYLGLPSHPILEIAFSSISRTQYAFANGLILMAIYHNIYKDSIYLDVFLNLPIWTILGKLIFCVYLIHVLTMIFTTSSLFNFYLPTTFAGLFTLCFVYVAVTFFFAFWLHVLVEAPCNSMINSLTKRLMAKTSAKNDKNNNVTKSAIKINKND